MATTAAVETCENCGATIGKLETPHVFKDHVVCATCFGKLQPPPQPLGYAIPIPSATAPPPPPPPQPQPAFNQQIIVQMPVRKWSAGTAALLSFLIPGAGQMYKGQVVNGLCWFVVVVIGYMLLVIPGVVLHLCCIVGAGSGDPYK